MKLLKKESDINNEGFMNSFLLQLKVQ